MGRAVSGLKAAHAGRHSHVKILFSPTILNSILSLHILNNTCVKLYWTKNINATCKVSVPGFMSWNKRSQKCFMCTKSVFLSNFVHKFVYIAVSEHFSFAKKIHPPDRCGISRSWLNSRIITQVHLVLGTIKGYSIKNVQICHKTQSHSEWVGLCAPRPADLWYP